MAKKSKVTIDVEAKGKGFKKVAVESKQAGEGLDSVAKNSKTAEKNVKGVAGTASAAGKQFAGMSRGMGGLVGAYAALAAEIFAISAAFNFLKAAGDLRVLEAGQNAYAASTGLAMRTLANDIVAATNAQINFKDAAQAAAIGTAAGLNAEQLERLGQAAKVTSQALGRDVTDSFNRLVRGVTKAEPELLDELGIILRLEEASRNYADSLNLNANSLTTFQKSQAVLLDVLRQSEEKFKVLYDTPIDVNPYQQLGKAFNDILMDVQKLVDRIAGPLAKVLTNTPKLAIAAFGLLLTGPLKALGFSFKELSANSKAAALEAKANADQMRTAYERLNVAINSSRSSLKALAKEQAAGTGSAALKGLIGGRDLSNKELGKLKSDLDRATKAMAKNGQIVRGVFAGMSVDVARNFSRMINSILADSDKLVSKTEVNFARVKSAGAGVVAGVKRVGAGLAGLATGLISVVGWASLAYTAFQILADAFDLFPETVNESEQRLVKLTERTKELNEQFKNFLENQKQIAGASGGVEVLGNIGNVVGSTSINDLKELVRLRKGYLQVEREVNEEIQSLDNNRPLFFSAQLAARTAKKNAQARLDAMKAGEEATEFINREIAAVKMLENDYGVTTKAAQNYIRALETGVGLEEAYELITLQTNLFKEIKRAAPEAEQAYTQFLSSFAGTSSTSQQLKILEDQLNHVTQAMEALLVKGGDEAMKLEAQRAQLQDRVNFMTEVRDLENEIAVSNIERQTANVRALQNQDEIQSNILLTAQKYTDNQAEIANLNKQITNKTEGLNRLTADQRDDAQAIINSLVAQRDLLEAQSVELLRQKGIAEGLIDLLYSQDAKKREIQALEERKAVLQVDQTRLKVLQDTLAVESDMAAMRLAASQREQDKGMFAGVGRDQRRAAEAVELEQSLFKKRQDVIIEEFKVRREMAAIEFDLLEAKLLSQANDLKILAGNQNLATELGRTRHQSFIDLASSIQNRAEGLGQQEAAAMALLGAQETSALAKLADDLDKLKDAKFALEDIQVLTKGIGDSIGQNMTSAFSSIIQGTSSVKDAFKNMAVNILKSIADIIAQMLAMRLIMSFIPGFSTPAPAVGMTDTVTPAMFDQVSRTARYGGMFKGYSQGGIARGRDAGYPAILHGTEAVVPLPNGNKIPVEMVNGSGAQNNNVTVNVAIDGNGNASSNTQQDSAQAGNLGNIIAKAVQQELQNQKRSGGILNPYGVA